MCRLIKYDTDTNNVEFQAEKVIVHLALSIPTISLATRFASGKLVVGLALLIVVVLAEKGRLPSVGATRQMAVNATL